MDQTQPQPRPFAPLALILIHLIVSTGHGWAHQAAMVTLDTFGYVYVVSVITLAPLVSAVFLLIRKFKIGALLLGVSMFGSFSFGFWYHFLSETGDNVSQVHGPWHNVFLWTAIALALIELAGTIVGIQLFRATSKTQ